MRGRPVIFKHLRGGGKSSEASPAAQMAAHIARIAGQPLASFQGFLGCIFFLSGSANGSARQRIAAQSVDPGFVWFQADRLSTHVMSPCSVAVILCNLTVQ